MAVIILTDNEMERLKALAQGMGINVYPAYFDNAVPSDEWFVQLLERMVAGIGKLEEAG